MSADLAAGRSRALQQLKTILLRHSEHIHESAQNGAAIVAALQSLLKCAEMRYRCCMVDDCDHASYAQAPAAADGLMMTTVTTTTALRGNVGDNLCCAAATAANSFDGDGGGNDQRTAGNGGAEDGGGRGAAVMVDSYSSDADVTDAEEGDDEDRTDGVARSASSVRRDERGSSDGSYITADEGYDVSGGFS